MFAQQIRRYATSRAVSKRPVNMVANKLPKTEPWAMNSGDWIRTGIFFGTLSTIAYLLTSQSAPFMNITKKKRTLYFTEDNLSGKE